MQISRVCCLAELCGVIMALAGGARGSRGGGSDRRNGFSCASTCYTLCFQAPPGPSEQRAKTLMHTHTNVYRYIDIYIYIYILHLRQTLVDTQDVSIYRRRWHDHMHLIILPMATLPNPPPPVPLPFLSPIPAGFKMQEFRATTLHQECWNDALCCWCCPSSSEAFGWMQWLKHTQMLVFFSSPLTTKCFRRDKSLQEETHVSVQLVTSSLCSRWSSGAPGRYLSTNNKCLHSENSLVFKYIDLCHRPIRGRPKGFWQWARLYLG